MKLRRDRDRIAARRGRNIGKVAARKLLTLVFYAYATVTSAASTAALSRHEPSKPCRRVAAKG